MPRPIDIPTRRQRNGESGSDTTTSDKDASRMSDGIEDTPSYTVLPPPARFSTNAKAAWDTAPETVRAEVLRMEKEFIAGFAKYKTAAERDASLTEFHLMAAKGRTTVKDALSKYVNMENLLRADTVKGLELICQNVGMSLREVAGKVLGLTTNEGNTTTEMVTKFASDPANSRFEELADDIAFFLKTRTKDLAEAYKLAERLNPAPAAQAPATQTEEAPAVGSAAAFLSETR
jgi:hypothetical protein